MLAEFSIYPLNQQHFSKEIAKVADLLTALNIEFKVGPMSTTLEGEWKEVMNAIGKCHAAMLKNHTRVLTRITIDDHKGMSHNIESAVKAVEDRQKETSTSHKVATDLPEAPIGWAENYGDKLKKKKKKVSKKG